MDNETSLAKVAFSLPPGSMVYLKSEDLFYLKVEDKDNTWRIIDMVSGFHKDYDVFKSTIFGNNAPFFSPSRTPKANPFTFLSLQR